MSSNIEKPTDRILIEVHGEMMKILHDHSLSSEQVAIILYAALEYLSESLENTGQNGATMIQ
jgi:hypothetical protein